MTRLVALSAAYGAGGDVVGPALAERLGVPFLDRAIPLKVAEQLEVPVDEADAIESEAESWLQRLLRGFVGSDAIAPAPLPAAGLTSEDFRVATEKVLIAQCEAGEGVMLGRAAAIVLREDPRVLRVRMDGPREARVAQAMFIGNVDEPTARRTLERLDHAHAEYARDLYGEDVHDPRLYHLVIDSTALELTACVELIALATASLGRTG